MADVSVISYDEKDLFLLRRTGIRLVKNKIGASLSCLWLPLCILLIITRLYQGHFYKPFLDSNLALPVTAELFDQNFTFS